jgi:hypothetical protein
MCMERGEVSIAEGSGKPQVRHGNRAGRDGWAEGNSPEAMGYSAFSNRSFSGGNLHAPLYKDPLVQ